MYCSFKLVYEHFSDSFALHMWLCGGVWFYPGDYREEREGDRSSGCICTLVQRQLIGCGPRPLIGQEAETYKVQEGPETWKNFIKKDKRELFKWNSRQTTGGNFSLETKNTTTCFYPSEVSFLFMLTIKTLEMENWAYWFDFWYFGESQCFKACLCSSSHKDIASVA